MKSRGPYFSALLIVSLALPSTNCAQTATPSNALPPVRLEVLAFSERRLTISSPLLTLEVKVPDEAMPPKASIKELKVSKVTDNLGRSVSPAALLVSVTPQSLYWPQPRLASLSPPPPSLQRNAKSLSLIEGTVDFYQPTEENGGIIRIPNITSHSGRLEHAGLVRHGITFRVLIDEASAQEAMALAQTYSGGWPDGINLVGYYLDDPANLVLGAELQDRMGKLITANPFPYTDGTTLVGRTVYVGGRAVVGRDLMGTVRLLEPLAADTQLVIYLAVPAAIRTAPFRLENLPLR